MNKARLYDDTLAYFVAGIKYKGQWYTENLATINDRKIGPGTIIIDSESNMRNIRQAAISRDPNTTSYPYDLVLTRTRIFEKGCMSYQVVLV